MSSNKKKKTPPQEVDKNALSSKKEKVQKPLGPLMIEESALGKQWRLHLADADTVRELQQKHGLSLVMAEVLASRGIDAQTAGNYLDPKIKNMMPDPSVMNNMDKAVERIADAIERGENVAVFGDFDVDGATSSALLKKYFRAIGHDIEVYIPHRVKEGYGPQIDAFKKLKKEKNVSLIITVDCGASAHSVIKEANKLNLSTIVLDHHQAHGELPPADAVVNPNHETDDCDLGYLAGCGVTFMTLVGLQRELNKRGFFNKKEVSPPKLMNMLDLVALGTVADVMPIIGLNRAFVKAGLLVMHKRGNMGLKYLMNAAGGKTAEDLPTPYTIGFVLGPRINAGGRLGDVPDLGARLLSTTSDNEAASIAHELNELNLVRQMDQADSLKQIYDSDMHITDDYFVALQDENWHPGIIGIMAGRIKDDCYKPTAIMTKDQKTGLWKGSARSVPQIDLGSIIINAVKEGILEGGGGHKMAAGFSLKEENITAFKKFVNEAVHKEMNGEPLVEISKATSVVSIETLTMDLAQDLEKLNPCGQGNPNPLFLLTNVKVKGKPRVFDKDDKDFIIATLCDDTGRGYLDAKVFVKKGTPLHSALLDQRKPVMHILGSISINEWNGRKSVELWVQDIVKDAPDLPLKKTLTFPNVLTNKTEVPEKKSRKKTIKPSGP